MAGAGGPLPGDEAVNWDTRGLKLVDQIDPAADSAHAFAEFPEGASRMETILGRPARALMNEPDSTEKYFGFVIGKGKGLQPGKTYMLEIDYPEDGPRSMIVLNRGCALNRGLQIGSAAGDAIHPPFVSVVPESLEIPLSKRYRTWRNLFQLHDRFSGIKNDKGGKPFVPEDGFWVLIAHFSHRNAPDSLGAAISAIRLYEVADEQALVLKINYPPKELPRRNLFWREEMADGAIGGEEEKDREVKDVIDWYEYKAKQMQWLGFNTYALDLLEFGSNQGWDSTPGGGNDWYYQGNRSYVWEAVLDRLRNYPDFKVLPYYEYCGSLGENGHGNKNRRAIPLNPDLKTYTHVVWTEKGRADLLDPETWEDLTKLLRLTIVRYKDKANFLGAWLRPRPANMPISFNEMDFKMFADEANGGKAITREELMQRGDLYARYIAWWNVKRRDFLNRLRDWLREQGVQDGLIYYTADGSEPGVKKIKSGEPSFVAEAADRYLKLNEPALTVATMVEQERHFQALTSPAGTWGGWEWDHAMPMYDPQNYRDNEGVLPTYTFNRAYTVMDPKALEAFTTKSGLALMRHFALNEHAVAVNGADKKKRNEILGYVVADMERTGPYVCMSEAIAMANGDPWHIGYLAGTRFTSGSPEYVRAFNQAFLALPALPSKVVAGASGNPAVVVRRIDTDGFGTYLAVINTQRTPVETEITMPAPGVFRDAAACQDLAKAVNKVKLKLYPFQLRALWYDGQPAHAAVASPVEVTCEEGATISIDVLKESRGAGPLQLAEIGAASHGIVRIAGNKIEYTPHPGFFGKDSFRYTIKDRASEDLSRVYVTVRDASAGHTLIDLGLKGETLGTMAGGSARFIGGGLAELTGFGSGFAGGEDSGYFEQQYLVGDFVASVHLDELTGPGLAGLCFRQGLLPASQSIALLAAADGSLSAVSRESAGAFPTSAVLSKARWLRLQRVGSLFTLATSLDGKNFQVAGTRILEGVSMDGHLGLVVTCGTQREKTRALFSGWDLQRQQRPSRVLFSQDFSGPGNASEYATADPSAEQFSEISSAPGAEWSVTPDGRLRLRGGAEAPAAQGGVLARYVQSESESKLLRLSFDLSLTCLGKFGDVAFLEWGAFKDTPAYTGTPNPVLSNRVTIRAGGSTSFILATEAGKSEPLAGNGNHRVIIYLNRSGADRAYTGIDGKRHTVGGRNTDLWIDGRMAWTNVRIPDGFPNESLDSFRIRVARTEGVELYVDNLLCEKWDDSVAEVPVAENRAVEAGEDVFPISAVDPVELNVLDNDMDPDNGPSGLKVVRVEPPAFGKVELAGRKLRYIPGPGLTKGDRFTYTVTDGRSEASASVKLTARDAGSVANLDTMGFLPLALGSARGQGRVVGGKVLELQGQGGAFGGTLDDIAVYAKEESGDFALQARLIECRFENEAALAGLILRENTKTDARMASLVLNQEKRPVGIFRRENGVPVERKGFGNTYAPPAVWLRIERRGEIVRMKASEDGATFAQVAEVVIPNLAPSVQVGLCLVNAYGRFDEFQIVSGEKMAEVAQTANP